MAKETYQIGDSKVRAQSPTKAAALASELAGEKATVSGAIPVSTLTTPKPTPMVVPTPTAPTVGAGLSANIATQAQQGVDAFTQEQAIATKAAESGYTNSLDAMLATLTSNEGQTGLTDRAYRDTVDPAKAALNKINQQILADQESERQQIMALKENARGLESAGLADKIGELQDKGIQRRAALAITQLAAQGEYQGAKEIADRAVSAALERQTIKNDTLKFIFEQNKERFTKAEQRQFETAQADRDRKLNMEEYKLKATFAQQLEESSPTARLDRQLKTLSIEKAQKELDALNNPSTLTGIDAATQAKMDKLPLTEKEALVNAGDTIDQLTRIKNLVATTDIATLQNPLTEEGLLFKRLATDVADKMARERTGAVVTAEEQGNFKRILGLSFLARLSSDPTVVNSEVDKFINKHEQTRRLIDPSGQIVNALSQNVGDAETNYIDAVANSFGFGGNSSVDAYLKSL